MMSRLNDMKCTLVLGVDEPHAEQLRLVWPNWMRHKPRLRNWPLVVFYDADVWSSYDESPLPAILGSHEDVVAAAWPPRDAVYPGFPGDRWRDPQRYKMLSGFVHVPPEFVRTEYWLKLDLDVVATGIEDWIDLRWFIGGPAIVGHRWGYTKPKYQMRELDDWFDEKVRFVVNGDEEIPPRLNLIPNPGSSLVKHERIISWCCFFNTEFTRMCSRTAALLEGPGMLPVPSQDGYLWYMAKRLGFGIERTNMKARGWSHQSNTKNVRRKIELVAV